MKTKYSKFLFIAIFFFTLVVPVSFAHAADCSSFTNLFNINSSNITPGSKVDTTNPATQVKVFCSAGDILTYALNLLFGFAGVAAVIFIILGGYWFVTSAGNEERAEKGRKTLVNSIIGLVVIILAATIVRIVVNTITGGTTGGSNPTTNGLPNGNGNNAPAATIPTQPATTSNFNNVGNP